MSALSGDVRSIVKHADGCGCHPYFAAQCQVEAPEGPVLVVEIGVLVHVVGTCGLGIRTEEA